MWNRRVFLGQLLVLAAGPAACDRSPETIDVYVGRTGGHPTLSIGHHRLIFEGVDAPGPEVPLLGSNRVLVGGSGTGRAQHSLDNVTITQSYDRGVQTLAVGGTSLKIVDHGMQFHFRNRTLTFHGRPETLLVAADGTVRSAE
jgi:hypothetical protein